jgi:hypothetical protein
MMNQLTSLYAAIGNSLDITPEQRAGLVEVTLARKLAFTLPLPSAKIESCSQYYSECCAALVRGKVSEFNEQFPINVVAVMDMANSFWNWRYTMVHPTGDSFSAMIRLCTSSLEYNSLKACMSPVYVNALKGSLPPAAETLIESFIEG